MAKKKKTNIEKQIENERLATLNLLEDLKTENEARTKSENALRESEERYRQLINLSPDAVVVHTDQHFVFVNPAAIKLFGAKNKEELLGRHISDFVHQDFQNIVQHRVKKISEGEFVPLIEEKFLRMDGTIVDVEAAAMPLTYRNKPSVQVVIRDITQRKAAEEVLTNERTLLRTIIDLMPDAVFVKDIFGRKILANKKEIELSGKKFEDEVIGKTDFDLYSETEAKLFAAEDKLVIECGKSLLNIEGKLIDKEGKEHWLIGAKVPLSDVHGKITGLVGVNHDFTERKQFEDELLKLSRAVEQSPASVVITDPEGDIEFVNTKFCEVSGYTKEEVLGKNPRVLKSGFHDKNFYTKLWDTISSGKEWSGEFLNRKKNGENYWESALISPVINKDGDITHYVAIKEDITEKKKMIEELIIAKDKAEEMNRLKSNFLSNMSHELRTPLNGILGYAEILTSLLEDAEQLDMVLGIYQSGRRLSDTLNFILDLSEAETGKIEVSTKDISVVPIVTECIRSFHEDAQNKNLQLETIIKDENIVAHLDDLLLKRIVHNILDNAIKFTKEGKISVEIGKEVVAANGETGRGENLYIKIEDTGIGIPADKIDLIWEEFRQVSEGISRSYEGPGLGLTISKKAVELMHGTIAVQSNYGAGSVFTVKFPALIGSIDKKEVPAYVPIQVDQLIRTETTGKHFPAVLYVEDDLLNRNMVKLFLKDYCLVDAVGDGKEALKLLTKNKYDVFLVDINLGEGMNGLDLVKEILNIPHYAKTPIVAVTAYAMGKDKVESLAGGCTHYLAKPFRKREIIDLVLSVVKKQ